MPEATLQEFLSTGIFTFMLTFTRLGAALMIMPALGDSFVSSRIRLLMAVAISFALSPIAAQYIPAQLPQTAAGFLYLAATEMVIGLFFGTVARIFMMAMDTAGMVISTMSGLGNAQVFNPSMASQGSIMGAFLSVTGVVVLFSTNLHHMLIAGMLQTYELFPVGGVIPTGPFAQLASQTVSASFAIGLKIGAPFVVLTLIIYVGMGVLSRVMPQVQVFILALPLQIWLSLVLFVLMIFPLFGYWASEFEEGISFFLAPR